LSLKPNLCSRKYQNYNSFMFKLYLYYVRLLCSIFVYSYCVQKIQKRVKIIFIRDQKQNKNFCEDENIRFNFLGTKIKIHYIHIHYIYIYRNEKLI